MSVYKRGRKWMVDLFDHAGIRRRFSAFPDKAASEILEHNLKRLVSFRASGGVPDLQLNRFIETLPPNIRDKLAAWGIIDSQRAASGKPLLEHITDWMNALEAKGDTIPHVKKSVGRIYKLADDCQWRTLSDITAISFDRWRVSAKANGLSLQTINHYLTVAKTLCNWLVRNRRLPENPLAHLSKRTVTDKDRRRIRRASDDMELEQLLGATMAGGKHHGLTGWERSLLYRLAFETGFRWSECRSLRKASFDFESSPQTVTVSSGKSKNKKEMV